MRQNRPLYLTNKWITILFGYYFIVLSIGVFLSVLALLPGILYKTEPSVLHLAIVGSIGMSANGSAIFYIRKLYKLCFAETLDLSDGKNMYAKRLGTIVYFLAGHCFLLDSPF